MRKTLKLAPNRKKLLSVTKKIFGLASNQKTRFIVEWKILGLASNRKFDITSKNLIHHHEGTLGVA